LKKIVHWEKRAGRQKKPGRLNIRTIQKKKLKERKWQRKTLNAGCPKSVGGAKRRS